MLRINQIKLNADIPEKQYKVKLTDAIAHALKVNASDISDIKIIRRSLDARKKPELYYSFLIDFCVKNESGILKKAKSNKSLQNNLSVSDSKKYTFPYKASKDNNIVIIGSGPAGLFCGLFLARAGFRPIVLERGENVDARSRSVEEFWENGNLKLSSNVQFGEGGAGTFSDGKLNTLIKDVEGLSRIVMETFTEFGADSKILYDAKPHIGTDVLKNVVKNIREEIIRCGGKVIFNSQAVDFTIENNRVVSVICQDGSDYPADSVVLAIGHSARDTFGTLYEKGLNMEQKPFSVGLRVQHEQSMINKSQYGRDAAGELGAAAYKVTSKSESGRGVFSFCMCPGGYVVNASSEEGMTAINGMSYSGRNGKNANSAIIISVKTSDYESDHPLAGVEFQRKLERKAYEIGQGKVPVQRYGSFKHRVEKTLETDNDYEQSSLQPEIKGEYKWCDVSEIMSDEFNMAFVEGMEHFDRMIHGFAAPDTILAGIESRTSSPLRIVRDEKYLSNIDGFFPCGEGAGYAGGITSAAIDGIKVAEAVAAYLT